jgi:hypothetical protein
VRFDAAAAATQNVTVDVDLGDVDPVDNHYWMCAICGDGGNIIICDTCPNSYHLQCLAYTFEGTSNDAWSCPDCQVSEYFYVRRRLFLHDVHNLWLFVCLFVSRVHGSNARPTTVVVSRLPFSNEFLLSIVAFSFTVQLPFISPLPPTLRLIN